MQTNNLFFVGGFKTEAFKAWNRGGFKVSLRWGDQNKPHWNLNSTDNFAGQKKDPGEGTLVATAFYYDWE